MTEHPIHWETEGTSRVPFAVYTDEGRHKKELERFFYKNHWSYVGLETEIPNVGDFKRTVVGERSVIICLPLPPVELHPPGRFAGRAVSAWCAARRQSQRRHARRL